MSTQSYYAQESAILAGLHARILQKMEEQGWKQSISSSGTCLYAGPNNTACAVGCLFDRSFAEKLDAVFGPVSDWSLDKTLGVMKKLDIPLEKMNPIRLRGFLNAMQHAHDLELGTISMKERMTVPNILRLFSAEHEDSE